MRKKIIPTQISAETPEQKAYRETVEQIAGNIGKLADASRPVEAGPTDTQMLDWIESRVGGCSLSAGRNDIGESPKGWIMDVWDEEYGHTSDSLRGAILKAMRGKV
jgi:hypothetical protein